MLELLQGPILKLLPDFAVMALGVVLSRRIDFKGWAALDTLNFYVLFPALLFSATSSRPIAVDRLLQVGSMTCLVVFAGLIMMLLLRRLGPDSWLEFAAGAQNAWRFSTPLAFVVAQVLPPEVLTLLAAGIGVMIPLVNALAVLVLSRGNATRKEIAIGVISNPFFLASVAGVLVNLSGLKLPGILDHTIDRVAQAALPMILMSIGAALNWELVLRPNRFAIAVHTVRLVALPALVWVVVTAFGLQSTLAAAVLLYSGLPTSSSAHLLAAKYGADQRPVAAIVTQSSVLGCITLPLWALVALTWVS
jgi:predicted permease